MSVSQETRHDDEQLIRYLLGLLPEEAAEQVDELSIVDEEVVWRLRTLEHDLVDAYVRGTLDATLREPFEAHYLRSPRRREKVEFARRLARAADAIAGACDGTRAVSALSPARDADVAEVVQMATLPKPASPRWRVWTFAAAAVLLIAAAALIVRDQQWRRGVEQAETARAAAERRTQALEQELRQQRQSAAEATAALERLRAERAAGTPGSAGTPGATPALSPAFALMLFPQTRGVDPAASGASLPTLAIAPAATLVQLDLRLEAPDFASYSAVLKDSASGRILWRSDRLALPSAADQANLSLVLSIPANVLSPRSCVIELSGHDASGAAESIGSYAFRTVRASRRER